MSRKRNLPRVSRIRLHDFSLYRNQRNVDVEVRSDEVFCLAGANGLGKSTFLAAINFGLTGIVAAPNRNFRNLDQYYEDSLASSRSYFDGRVTELDRPTAEIELTFSVGDKVYTLSRNLFEPSALRKLSIEEAGGTLLDFARSDDLARNVETHDAYMERIVRDCDLGSFSQFVFMQHFLLTFDERRHLLFWDTAVTEPALYLTFGLDADDTVRASDLRRKIAKAESDARNAQWQATQARNRLRVLGADTSTVNTEDLVAQHQKLTFARDSANEAATTAVEALRDAEIRQAEAAALQEKIRRDFDRVFAQRTGASGEPANQPLVRMTLSSDTCGVCGTHADSVGQKVLERIHSGRCPLCDSELRPSFDEGRPEKLREIDIKLSQSAKEFEALSETVRRLSEQTHLSDADAHRAAQALAEFELANDRALSKLKSASGSTEEQAAQIILERQAAERRRDEFRRQRESFREELRPIQNKLANAYSEAELEFVPLFRSLAYKFIGLDLDIYLEPREATGFSLGLEVEGVRRRQTTQLSESQRFFLDIALRMALAEHMSEPSSPAALFIDTPEGSLDIAYEARAGDMFADYVDAGHQIIMTANINASQLLRRLAKRCGSSKMTLARMTDWAPLSEVQATEEGLFDEAFGNIERDLLVANRPSEQ